MKVGGAAALIYADEKCKEEGKISSPVYRQTPLSWGKRGMLSGFCEECESAATVAGGGPELLFDAQQLVVLGELNTNSSCSAYFR